MSNKVDTPEIEAKKLFAQVIEGEQFLFDYFFEVYRILPDNYKSKEDYMRDLKEQYLKLKIDYSKRLLGLE